jgi:hypothetical protein
LHFSLAKFVNLAYDHFVSQVEDSTKSKSVKLDPATWESAKREALDRRSTFAAVITAAVRLFLALPEYRRSRLIDSARKKAA